MQKDLNLVPPLNEALRGVLPEGSVNFVPEELGKEAQGVVPLEVLEEIAKLAIVDGDLDSIRNTFIDSVCKTKTLEEFLNTAQWEIGKIKCIHKISQFTEERKQEDQAFAMDGHQSL
jgi:hypothetical protein